MKKSRVGNVLLPAVFIGKWWANDKAVCLHYMAYINEMPPYFNIEV